MGLRVDPGREGATFGVKVQPGAGRTQMAGVWQEQLKLKVSKKAEDGAANQECLAFLARQLKAPRTALTIIKGEFTRVKVIRVAGLSAEDVKRRLEEALAASPGACRGADRRP